MKGARRDYELVIHEGTLPPMVFEQSPAEADFLDLHSNPKRRRELAEWRREALASGVRRIKERNG